MELSYIFQRNIITERFYGELKVIISNISKPTILLPDEVNRKSFNAQVFKTNTCLF